MAATDPPAGYAMRHACTLPRLTVAGAIADAGRVETCLGCGRKWVCIWGRDPGGESQPQWVFFPQILDLMARTPIINRALPIVAGMTIGGTLPVTVTWDEAFRTTTYKVKVIVPAALLGKVTWALTSQTKTGAVITLTATAVVLAGATLDVTAYEYV